MTQAPVKLLVGTLLWWVGQPVSAQTREIRSPAVRALAASLNAGARGAPEAFWHTIGEAGTPLVEPHPHPDSSIVTFLYRGGTDLRSVRLASGLNTLLVDGIAPDVDQLGYLSRVPGTDVWYLSFAVRRALRVAYRFEVSEALSDSAREALDPLNPRLYRPDREALRASLLELPHAPAQPWHEREEAGSWRTGRFADARGQENEVYIYLPADFDSERANPYPVLVGLDSYSFGIGMPGALLLDHLIATGGIPPTVLVAANLPRGEGLEQLELTASYVVQRLLPELRADLNLAADPRQVVIAGTSRRGLIAAYTAFMHPDAVGNVLSLSGSFYWKPDGAAEYEWLTHRFAAEPLRRLRLFLAAGTLETVVTPRNGGHYMVGANRHLRDVLRARGYDVAYWEFEGDHSALSWQDGLARGLSVLLGASGDP